ncbi:hypothetical protein FOL47_009541 [Perkinsus chesapeaki]|uniref:Uncharacterized protein n=1 Tax=Perkinsus chesapeaki TaxID=330153 RepID=A0A7J6L7P4_PERCH|nr:hypothetical protein FOL47_009541 [Perkinsus chesapeaki]
MSPWLRSIGDEIGAQMMIVQPTQFILPLDMLTFYSAITTAILFTRCVIFVQALALRSAREELTSDKSFMNFEEPDRNRKRKAHQNSVEQGIEGAMELQPMSHATAAIPHQLKGGGLSKVWLEFDNTDRISSLSYIARQTRISRSSAFIDFNVLVDKELLSNPHLLVSNRTQNFNYVEGAFGAYDRIKRQRYACRVSVFIRETVNNSDKTVAKYQVYMSKQERTDGFHIDSFRDLLAIEWAYDQENMEGGFDIKKLRSMNSHSTIVRSSSKHPTIGELGDQCKAQIDSFGRTAASFLGRIHEPSVSKSVLNIFNWVFNGTQLCNITENMTVGYHIYPTIGNQIILGKGYTG